jgi:hypothetical protein
MLILSISQQNIYIPIDRFISKVNRCFLFWIRNGKATILLPFITALEFISKLNGHWLSKFTYLFDNLNANDWLAWENIILTRSKQQQTQNRKG